MKFKIIITAAIGILLSGLLAYAAEFRQGKMTIVSWGGAYSKSQLKAYHEPYLKK